MTASATATYDTTLGRVTVSAAGFIATSDAVVSRSLDGVTWTGVQGAGAVPLISGALAFPVYDRVFAPDVANTYRVVAGAETATATVTPAVRSTSLGVTWIHSPTRPFLAMAVDVVDTSPVVTEPARAGVFNVLGRTLPVAVTDVRQSKRWTMQVRTLTQEDADLLEAILASGDVLYVAVPPGSNCNIPASYVIAGDATVDWHPLRPLRRHWTVPVVQVDALDPARPAAAATWQSLVAQQPSWSTTTGAYTTWAVLLADLVGDPSEVYSW